MEEEGQRYDDEDPEQNYHVRINFTDHSETNTNCVIDSGTTHTILQSNRYFTSIRKPDECMKITTINGKETNISGIGEAILKLPGGAIIRIENAIHISTAM
jgi:hypothetical protein